MWLCPQPDAPWRGEGGAWGGSIYQRTCVQSVLLDTYSGRRIAVLSTHFDNEGDDELQTGGSEARRQSAVLVMGHAHELVSSGAAEFVVLAGGMNTFGDRSGAAYSALVASADGRLQDVREAPGAVEVDAGRGSGSWEGWETDPNCRMAVGDQRYDQIFVSTTLQVRRTTVVEERYSAYWEGAYVSVYASDHLPVVVDLGVPVNKEGRERMKQLIKMVKRGCAPGELFAFACLIGIGIVLSLLFLGIMYAPAGPPHPTPVTPMPHALAPPRIHAARMPTPAGGTSWPPTWSAASSAATL